MSWNEGCVGPDHGLQDSPKRKKIVIWPWGAYWSAPQMGVGGAEENRCKATGRDRNRRSKDSTGGRRQNPEVLE